jgi:peptidyl-prolyl cis-trans isomerase B (cyclophilin B)
MKRRLALAVCMALVLCTLFGCKKGNDALLNFTQPKSGDQVAVLETTMGNIKVMFFKGVAPKAVENFITHAKNGYYNNVTFHRVIEDFMIQGGDPLGTGTGGESIWGTPFKNEVSDKARNFRGALAMANAGADTNGSQFFIVQAGKSNISDSTLSQAVTQTRYAMSDEVKAKYKEVGGAPWLDGGYTVFGQVLTGMDVVDKIAAVQVDAKSKPLTPVLINKITIETVK